MLRTIYGFDDLGRKVPTGSYDDGLSAVGGRIFYIDSNSDETVEFYDSQGNVLSNVGVGDTPSYYKVTSTGVSGKDKFYIYPYPFNANNYREYARWTYYENGNYVYEHLGFYSLDLGAGKSNTNGIIAFDNGAYIKEDSNGYPTLWYKINQLRMSNVNECGDWYIPSRDELLYLRAYIRDNASSIGESDIFRVRRFMTSSEHPDERWYYYWNGANFDSTSKSNEDCFVFIRSF